MAARAFRAAAPCGLATVCSAELDRREDWRATGATSLGAWLVQQLGVCAATARAYSQVAEHVSDLPHLGAGLLEGRLSLDKVRSVLGVATPENEAEWAEAAESLGARPRALVRSKALPTRGSDRAERGEALAALQRRLAHHRGPAGSGPLCRRAFRARVPGKATAGSDGETPSDQRRADAFVACDDRGGAVGRLALPLVVAHVPFESARPRVRAPRRAQNGRAHQRRVVAAPGLRGHGDRRPRRHVTATPCTRAGPSASRPPPSAARSPA